MIGRLLPVAALLGALLLGLWLRPAPSPQLQSFSLFTLGTLVEVRIADPVSAEQVAAAQAELTALFADFQTRWSPLLDGDLAAVNRALALGQDAPLPPALEADFALARQLCQQSQGRFDPALGQLVALWGFESEEDPRSSPPTEEEIAAAQGPSWCSATWQENRLQLPGGPVRLNFGGMAKGRAVGLALDALRQRGIHNAIVNAGGDLQVAGQHPLRPWHIGVRDPNHPDPQRAIAAIDLHDGESLFSSGDYERWFEADGVRYHHLLDPATGRPARRSRSATVLHTDPALADAAATALFVAGPEQAESVAKALGVQHWMLMDASGQTHSSASMAARLQWIDAPSEG